MLLSTICAWISNPSQLATAVLSGFREYQGAVKEPGYHPLIAALTHILETGVDDYGWGDEDVELAEKLLQRGTALLQSGEWGPDGGDLDAEGQPPPEPPGDDKLPEADRCRPATACLFLKNTQTSPDARPTCWNCEQLLRAWRRRWRGRAYCRCRRDGRDRQDPAGGGVLPPLRALLRRCPLAGRRPEHRSRDRRLRVRHGPAALAGKQAEQVRDTLLAWQSGRRRLVVLDNVADQVVIETWPARLGNASILFTTRQVEWPEGLGVAVQPLGLLERGESLCLLRKLAPGLKKETDEALGGVAERLGDLPLALDLAGRFFKDNPGLTPGEYLGELDEGEGRWRTPRSTTG